MITDHVQLPTGVFMLKAFYEKSEIETLIKESQNFREVLTKLHRYGGWANKKLRQSIIYHNIDTSHFETRSQMMKKRNLLKGRPSSPIESLLVEGSSYSRGHLKSRLYKTGLKTRFCELCGQGEDWRGKHMSLILDHVNGVYNDHRLENLRIVCPNCNATLDTHCGKNMKVNTIKLETIPKIRPSKINWPSNEEMKKLVWSMPRTKLSNCLGVSDVAIRKHCEKCGIEIPGKGYFSRIENRGYGKSLHNALMEN